jgi:hypothetical protein
LRRIGAAGVSQVKATDAGTQLGAIARDSTIAPGLVEIIRVLHERMEPGRHLREVREDE